MTNQDDLETNKAFLEKCRPKLAELETIRLAKLKAFQFRKKIGIPLGAVLTPFLGFFDYWLVLLQRGSDDTAAGISVAGLGALWWWVTSPKRQYSRAYKKDILPDIARLFGNFIYDVKGKIPMEAMKPSKIVPSHTQYKSEDFFSGTYKAVQIDFSEIHLKRKQGKNSYKTVFKGLAILLSQGTKQFHGHTIMTQDKGKIGSWFKEKTSNFKRADLVDPEFEKLFDVFTTDQVEARYLIDPRIIENLKSLYHEYNGKQMMVAFYEDHVLIMIGSDVNHFEPADITIPATDEASLLAMKREIEGILSIVDRLALYDPKTARQAA
jgi:hypothetical protein